MNVREQLTAIADWLGWQDESLSFGLVNSLDAMRLYDFAQANPMLPEMADEWTPEQRIEALGYDPLATQEAASGRCVGETGVIPVLTALESARCLIDSVAFVATEGDSAPVLDLIRAVTQR